MGVYIILKHADGLPHSDSILFTIISWTEITKHNLEQINFHYVFKIFLMYRA